VEFGSGDGCRYDFLAASGGARVWLAPSSFGDTLQQTDSTNPRLAGIPLRVIDDGLKIYATGVFVSVGMDSI